MEKIELENGIIDSKMADIVVKFRLEHKQEYEIIELYNNLINELIKCLLGRGATQQNVYILTNIIEMQKLYQSSILLLERGVPECANILIRTMIEVLINITEVINNPDTVSKLLTDNDYEVKNAIEYLKQTTISIPQELVDKINNVRGLDKLPKREKRITKELAEKNKMNEMYALFKFNSEYTHMSTDVVGRLIKKNKGNYLVDATLNYVNFKMDVGYVLTIIWSMIEVILKKYNTDEYLMNKFKETNDKFMNYYQDMVKSEDVE